MTRNIVAPRDAAAAEIREKMKLLSSLGLKKQGGS